MKKPFDSRAQTSTLEFALAKPVKCSKKFVVKSSGLSIAEKATAATVRVANKKTYSASTGGSGMTRASTRVLDLFGLGSSVSDDETTLREPPHKRARKFPLPKVAPKGNFE
jgi:hypothetical protein